MTILKASGPGIKAESVPKSIHLKSGRGDGTMPPYL